MKIFTSAHLVLVIRFFGDKTFLFATCDSDEHCSMDATVTLLYIEQVTAVCVYIYTLLGTTTGSPRVGSGAVRIGPTPFPDRRS